MQFAHYLLVAAALPLVVLVPGYAVLRRFGVSAVPAVVGGPGVTLALVGALTALLLLAPVSGVIRGLVVFAVLVGVAVAAMATGPRPLAPGRAALVPAGLLVATFAFLVGFNAVPSNPPGTTTPCAPVQDAGGYVTPNQGRACAFYPPATLTMNRIPNRSGDDFLQYRTAQAAFNRKLFDQAAYYGGWQLQDRTPLVGLAVAGLGPAAGVSLPEGYPPQPDYGFGGPLWLKAWGAPSDSTITPQSDPKAFESAGSYRPEATDEFGYWFYRLVAMLTGALVVLPVYLLALELFDRRVATLAAVAAGISPAIMVNAYFTSPKYLGVYYGILGALLVMARRPALAGMAVGAAYLCHPLGAILGASVLLYQGLTRLRGTGVLALAAVLVAIPWLSFTAATGSQSSLLLYPLGCVGPGIEVDDCLESFKARTVSSVVWQRAQAIPTSIVPYGLETPLQPSNGLGLRLKYLNLHDFTFSGMAGILFFPFALYGLILAWGRARREIVALVFAQIAVMAAIWGLDGVPAVIAGLGVLPAVFVFGAYGTLAAGRRLGRWIYVAVSAEWVLYIVTLFEPVEGIALPDYVFGLAVAIGALGALVVAGGRQLWPPGSDPQLPAPEAEPETQPALTA